MRVLHAALMQSYEPGILKQMYSEQQAARRVGLAWSCLLRMPHPGVEPIDFVDALPQLESLSFTRRILTAFMSRYYYYKKIASIGKQCDVVFLRYRVADPMLFFFLLISRLPVYTVHHTLEVPELARYVNFKGKLKFLLEKQLGKWNLRLVEGVVCVTGEIASYEKNRARKNQLRTYIYPNGILVDSRRTLGFGEQRFVPEILFVANNFVPWHGLDLLLADISNSHRRFVLHIVGAVSSELISDHIHDKRIILHGKKFGRDLEVLMQRSWIGLSSFALFRKGMQEACTLKVREYLLEGLPVYSGHKDGFPPWFSYYREGPPLIDEILDFAESMKHVPPKEVREASLPFISKELLMQKLYSEIKGDLALP